MITTGRVYIFCCLAWVMYLSVAELGRTGSYWMALLEALRITTCLILGMLFGQWLAKKV